MNEPSKNDDALLEEDESASLRALLETVRPAPRLADIAEPPPAAGGLLIGEVLDSHNPDLPGRLLVGWTDPAGDYLSRWLQSVRHIAPALGARVILAQPLNWPEPLITAVLTGGPRNESADPSAAPGPRLQLGEGQSVWITDSANTPLIAVHSSERGPVVRLLSPDISLEAAGTLRLAADTIEMEAGKGGVDIRTDADTVVRSRFIRLN
ncbi:MAG: hypothetical protein FIA97_19455 [Methylococcaceae bacterium]|nr:hypothetical protein [Methylococcaceae bacterium]